MNAVLRGGQLELTAVSGGELYTKSISLDETTACAVQKCYGRANCIVITGFNRLTAALARTLDTIYRPTFAQVLGHKTGVRLPDAGSKEEMASCSRGREHGSRAQAS